MKEHLWFMGLALEEAEQAYRNHEVPVGVVIVSSLGKVIVKTYNQKEKTFNPCGHAEILALEQAGKISKSWRLEGAYLYVTLEPCTMCLAAMVHARIESCFFGAYDKKGGALSLGYNFFKDTRLNHRFAMVGGVKHYECSKLLSTFFKERRESYQG